MFKTGRFFPLLLILSLTFILRASFLSNVPSGISNDELDYILNSKAVFLTGSDISGTWNPFSLKPPESSFPQAELPPVIMSLFIGILPLGLFYSKLPYVIVSVMTILLVFLITKKILGGKEAIFISLVGALNPWNIFFGRTAYDFPLTIFFYLLSFYLLISLKGWKILFAFVPLFLAFHSYIGTKLIFLPVVGIFVAYSFFFIRKRKFFKQHAILFLLSTSLFLFSLLSFFVSPPQRASELFVLNSVSPQVQSERRLSLESPFKEIFTNKLTVYSRVALEKYLAVFSTNLLFLHGDTKSEFTLWNHGLFYYFDFILLVLGLVALYFKKKDFFFLLLALLLISPIPSVLREGTASYAVRSYLLNPVFIIFIGYGFFMVFDFLKSKNKYLPLILFGFYFLLVLNFSYVYFLRNPVNNPESFNFSSRVLSRYLSLSSIENGATVFSSDPKTQFKQYLFFTNKLDRDNAGIIASKFKNNEFEIDKISFMDCEDVGSELKGSVIVEISKECEDISIDSTARISQLSDSGTIFRIQNDSVCKGLEIGDYPSNIRFKDLNVQKLNSPEFCSKFISRLN